MIAFVVSRGHKYTHESLAEHVATPSVLVLSYDQLWRRRRISPATYVFTDFDRLNFWQLQLAALTYNRIALAGWQPLNNPAQVRQRYALLRRLYEAGINQFGVFRVETGEMPGRYPVFLRSECGHQGSLTGLIADREELLREIETAIAAGNPERHLLITEYAAEPIRPGIYRRYGMFRIGDRIFPSICLHNEIVGDKIWEDGNSWPGVVRRRKCLLTAKSVW